MTANEIILQINTELSQIGDGSEAIVFLERGKKVVYHDTSLLGHDGINCHYNHFIHFFRGGNIIKGNQHQHFIRLYTGWEK